MAIRALSDIKYIPLLGLKPAETQALQELPQVDKRLMMPLFQIGPWASAHHLQSAISKLEDAYGDLPCFVTLADLEPPNTERPVHRQLAELHAPANGYGAWCAFIESKNHFVPTLQIGDFSQLQDQTIRLHSLGRGLMVVIERAGFGGISQVAAVVARATNGGQDVCFLLDLGRATRDIVGLTLVLSQHVTEILQVAPLAHVAISASSFPESFTSINNQEIFERTLFDSVVDQVGGALIYSDRGSARAERQGGGGGIPAPRVDYATRSQWAFYRSVDEDVDRNTAYLQQAARAMAASDWDGNLRIWGTQMIERTALGDTSAITSPKRCTAARINIHLHRQTFYGDTSGLYDTDDTWSD